MYEVRQSTSNVVVKLTRMVMLLYPNIAHSFMSDETTCETRLMNIISLKTEQFSLTEKFISFYTLVDRIQKCKVKRRQ